MKRIETTVRHVLNDYSISKGKLSGEVRQPDSKVDKLIEQFDKEQSKLEIELE